MVKMKNANIGRGENVEEGGSSRGRGKRRMEVANFEEWTRKRRKIIFQYFMLNLIGAGDPIGPGKIYNKYTFKRMGFERNEEGQLVRGGQDENDEDDEEDDDDDEEQEEINVDEEESDTEPEEETNRREIRQKKRQERIEEGQSSVDMAQFMAKIITMQSQLNSRLDDIDGKLHNRLDDINDKINKRSIFGVSRLYYIEAKDLGDQDIMKKKISSHSKIKYGNSLEEIFFTNYT
ncbi:hypothetical protein M9H77_12829 [Catharanthus roseus]|uniref:Uncharacterized protein n=1 Tax=Catharanthus roseus TaxID=4058 RepID=A0ACC0BIL1_CATRO|nr:hypothetical protein M9H77_12829 [Catharanthus roseus]